MFGQWTPILAPLFLAPIGLAILAFVISKRKNASNTANKVTGISAHLSVILLLFVLFGFAIVYLLVNLLPN